MNQQFYAWCKNATRKKTNENTKIIYKHKYQERHREEKRVKGKRENIKTK